MNCETCDQDLPGKAFERVRVFCSITCLDLAEERNDGHVHNFRIISPLTIKPLKRINMDTPKSETALRYNKGKLAWGLIHWKCLSFMVEVLMFGAQKYAPNDWKKGMNRTKLLESMQRHVSALFDGETHDEDSKFHHIGHVMCNCMFYAFYVLNPELEIPYKVDGDFSELDRVQELESAIMHDFPTNQR
jgi:hypothetical protein